MNQPNPNPNETDPRFPSGPWTGFFTQPVLPGKHLMELRLTFQNGVMNGEGRDWVGRFVITGRYTVADGRCHWTKKYLGKHDVFYKGYNEGKGIWGVWEIPKGSDGQRWTGGFYIWPEGMPDPTQQHLTEEADVPVLVEQDAPLEEAVPAPVV
jgi:hypothetical protein